MSGLVTYAALRSPAAASAGVAYLSNANHPDHLGYELTPVAGPDGLTPEALVARTIWAWSRLGYEYGPHLPTTMFYWWFVTFRPYAWLTDPERMRIQDVVVPLATLGGPHVLGWHIDRIAGACDLNVVVPNLGLVEMPHLNRLPGVHVPNALQARVDAAIDVINAGRREAGKFPLPSPAARAQARMQQRHGTTVEREAAKQALEQHLAATPENLPALLDFPGIVDWSVNPRRTLAVTWKRDDGKRSFTIPLDRFFAGLAWQVDRLRSRRYRKQRLRGHPAPWSGQIAEGNSADVMPPVARTLAVLHAAETRGKIPFEISIL
ncbi:MAG TPA: hypothetical protein VHD62_09600 [Opitutaceae bacterium]|nr:hypothetical protein [Opitutaceae bacterium]